MRWILPLVGAAALSIGCDDSQSSALDVELAGGAASGIGGEMGQQPAPGGAPSQGGDPSAAGGAPNLPDFDPPQDNPPPEGPPPDGECRRADDTPRVDSIDMDTRSVTLGADGKSEMLSLDLPDDVLSVSILILGSEQNLYVVNHFEGPDGQILVAEMPPGVTISRQDRFITPFPGPFNSPNPARTAGEGVAGFIAPNTPDVSIVPGEWRWQVAGLTGRGSPAAGDVEVVIEIKRAPGGAVRGALDLHFYFSGSHGWTAAKAPDDADFQTAVTRMCRFYNEIGIVLGDFTYDDVDAEFQVVDSITGPGNELHRLFAHNTYDTGAALFFVDRINSPFGGGVIGGVSGGAPGPTLVPSTVRSGLAVATGLQPDPRAIGHIMGHETGHYLGLFHTREITGQQDPISDTPPNAQTNLMFPTVTAGIANLSDGQGFVLRGSPVVHTVEVSP